MKTEISESILKRFAEEIATAAEDNVADEHYSTGYSESSIEDEVELESGWCIQFTARIVQRNEQRTYDYPGYSELHSVSVTINAVYDEDGEELPYEAIRHAEKTIQEIVNKML